MAHLRANLWLLLFTVLLCSVLYPLALYASARPLFRNKAEGSLIDARGEPTTDVTKAVGSRLIAQPFVGDEYFQPRPRPCRGTRPPPAQQLRRSNPALRERVVLALGPILKYRNGEPVGPDVEKWFVGADRERAAAGAGPLLVEWSKAHSSAAAAWVKDHAEPVALWLNEKADAVKDKPDEAAGPFFAAYATAHPATWPGIADDKSRQVISPTTTGNEIRSAFFMGWWQANPKADLEPVPADLVMTSASGLDPDVTLKARCTSSTASPGSGPADRPRQGPGPCRDRADAQRPGRGAAGRPGRGQARQRPRNQRGAARALREGKETGPVSRHGRPVRTPPRPILVPLSATHLRARSGEVFFPPGPQLHRFLHSAPILASSAAVNSFSARRSATWRLRRGSPRA